MANGTDMCLRILAVEDEADILNMLRAMLEMLGCEVVALTDSRQAAEQVEQQRFDGVFVDGLMPHMDGFELARRIRGSKLNADVPIAMLSGSVGIEVKREDSTQDVTFFVAKPVNPQMLREVLAAMARNKEPEVRP